MKPTQIGISYYRSIGNEPVTLDLTKKFNVLVGPNNCGKSNVLRALVWFGTPQNDVNFSGVDQHNRSSDTRPCFHLAFDTSADPDYLLRQLGSLTMSYNGAHRPAVSSTNISDLEWNSFSQIYQRQMGSYFNRIITGKDRLPHDYELALKLSGDPRGKLSPVGLIPQFREIRPGEKYTISGHGVVKLLAEWQHPEIEADADNIKFNQVQTLLRQLLDAPNVELEVSHRQDEIIVRRDGLRLPLTSYGTGIHEIIILAIAVLSFNGALVCIEEPEIHLHPLLQRRFVEFLRGDTKNRYVITTHAPALITPSEDTNVIHLWMENGITKSRTVKTSADSLRALNDLGAQASDLLQANSVIWVEGPSDRIYVNRWLELVHLNKYREGIDYTVMFYGGRLLSHLSMQREQPAKTDEDEAGELIQLLRINQHSAILIDSDRRKASVEINTTKQRIQKECLTSGVYCWTTPGREIENSVPVLAIQAAYAELCGQPITLKLGRYQSIEDALNLALKEIWPRASYYDHAKAQTAWKISSHMTKEQLSTDVQNLITGIVGVIDHKSAPSV